MNGKQQREQFSTTFPTKFVNLLRKHAFVDNRITMSEMIERYQRAYLKELEHEKTERKHSKNSLGKSEDEVREMYRASFSRELDREKAENIKETCDSCGKISDYPCRM